MRRRSGDGLQHGLPPLPIPRKPHPYFSHTIPRTSGRYLEIFARKNNLRNYWVSIGNEVTGTGLPEADMDALRQSASIPNAVYGRANTRERI